jgi:hypothetical protein
MLKPPDEVSAHPAERGRKRRTGGWPPAEKHSSISRRGRYTFLKTRHAGRRTFPIGPHSFMSPDDLRALIENAAFDFTMEDEPVGAGFGIDSREFRNPACSG